MKFPFGQDGCELVFGVDVFDLEFGVQINSVEQPIKSNSVGSGDVSHCWTSAFDNHFELQLHCPPTHSIKLLGARIGHLKEQNQCLASHQFSIVRLVVFVFTIHRFPRSI